MAIKPVPIEYVSRPMTGSELVEHTMDEIKSFVEYYNIKINNMGFVEGDLTPSDALMLAYKLIAWKVLSDEMENAKLKQNT